MGGGQAKESYCWAQTTHHVADVTSQLYKIAALRDDLSRRDAGGSFSRCVAADSLWVLSQKACDVGRRVGGDKCAASARNNL